MKYDDRGDTIIEVLFAFTVFSLLAVGAVIIMNQGISAAQKSLEITLVRQQIDAQAEALRYVRDTYFESLTGKSNADVDQAVSDWAVITKPSPVGKAVSAASAFGVTADGSCQTIPITNAFILDAHNGVLSSQLPKAFDENAPAYSQVIYKPIVGTIDTAYGIWIEAVKSSTKNYVDFHIRACWNGPGSGPSSTLGTIVRLYAPTIN